MRAVLALGMALLITPVAWAQQQSREREALRRAQQQVSKLQQDSAALQREKADLEAKLKALESEVAKLKGQVGRLRNSEKSLAGADQDRADLKAKLAASEERSREQAQRCQADLGSLRASLAQTQAAGVELERDSAQERNRLNGLFSAETERARSCEEKNRQLYSVTMDLVDRYKHNRSAWEKFLLSEPFTGLKSVQVENLLDDMRTRAAEAKVRAPPK